MRNTKPLGSQGQKENPKPKNPTQMSFSKFCLEMVRDLSHCHKIPLGTQKATLSKKNAQRLLAKSEVLLQSFLRGISTAKAVQFVTVPQGGICWH